MIKWWFKFSKLFFAFRKRKKILWLTIKNSYWLDLREDNRMHTNDALFPLIEDKKKQVIRSWWRLYYCLFYGDICKNKFFVSTCNKKGRVHLYIIYLSTVPRVYIRHNLQFDRSCAIGLPPRLYSNANIQKERLMCVSIEIVYTL